MKLKLVSNRFSIIFYCALFNLLFEYSARGVFEFINRPSFILILFGIYFTYFAILEDLIVRFNLKNYQIFLVAFFYGLLPTAFLTGNLFNQNIYYGLVLADVNFGTVIVIGILAWGVVQGMITLYLANRLIPRDWSHPRMGKIGWIVAILFQVFAMGVAHLNPVTPRGTVLGYLVLGVLLVISAGLFMRSLKTSRSEPQVFQPSVVMDVLAFGSIILFLILGTFFVSGDVIITSQSLNELAVRIENYWVFFCGIVFFSYRFWKKSDITV